MKQSTRDGIFVMTMGVAVGVVLGLGISEILPEVSPTRAQLCYHAGQASQSIADSIKNWPKGQPIPVDVWDNARNVDDIAREYDCLRPLSDTDKAAPTTG